jgi:hypothetical protein
MEGGHIMMSLSESKGLLEKLESKRGMADCYVCLPMAVGTNPRHILNLLKEIKEMGYRGMVRTTEFGDEVVITDKVS